MTARRGFSLPSHQSALSHVSSAPSSQIRISVMTSRVQEDGKLPCAAIKYATRGGLHNDEKSSLDRDEADYVSFG